MNKWDTVGGRRYIMCMGACIICSIMTWFGKLEGVHFADIVIWVTGLYITGNVAQRAGNGLPDVFNRMSEFRSSGAPREDSASARRRPSRRQTEEECLEPEPEEYLDGDVRG